MAQQSNNRINMQPRLHCCCPDFDPAQQLCSVSFSRQQPSARSKMLYCTTDDYDNCPIYLCNALRSSSRGGINRENLAATGK